MKRPVSLGVISIIFISLTVYLNSCKNQTSSKISDERPFYKKPEHEKSQIIYPKIQSYIEENKDDAIKNYYFIKDIEKMLGNDIFAGNIYLKPQGNSVLNKETLVLYANNTELNTDKYLKSDKEKGYIKNYHLLFVIDSTGNKVLGHRGIIINSNSQIDTIMPRENFNIESSRAIRSRIEKISADFAKKEKIKEEEEKKFAKKRAIEEEKREKEEQAKRLEAYEQERFEGKLRYYGVEAIVGAKNIYAEYKYNGVAAQKKYGGKKIYILGRITEINLNQFSGEPYIRFEVTDFGGVYCNFSNANNDDLSNLRPGQQIEIVGICDRFSAEYVVVSNCQLF